MEMAENDVVHPEVRAHISSLVSALGGTSTDDDDDDGQYKLGDDALAVLRDIKKWIRFYDERMGRMDVARCLAEANVVGGDLLPIVAQWRQDDEDGHMARVALACFEVMVPLTWPMTFDPERMTVNHHRHIPVLQLAQLEYKKLIINYDGVRVLHAAVRTALPSMALPMGERTARDQAIIKLLLFFLRNVAMTAPPPGAKYDGEPSLVSRSATIDAFAYQDIFLVLLTVASNMGDDFRTEDVIVMEIMFHLVKRVDAATLFLDDKQLGRARGDELKAILKREKAMLRSYQTHGPTRHNRFGSMVWVKRQDGKMAAVSGQEALLSASARESKMDESKKFKPARRAKADVGPKDLGPPVSLNARANGQLRSFVKDFLDSAFNPLFRHVRQSLTREAPHVLGEHHDQFFYLVAWFLGAERNRRRSKKASGSWRARSVDEVRSFNLVAGVLDQEMFSFLIKSLNQHYDNKEWAALTAVMRCFSQILLTVQDMFESGDEDDQEIAENMLMRLFYEERTHDAVVNTVRFYKDQGFEYLDAATELAHVYIRMLEGYSKQNVDLQVRSRRRRRRRKRAAAEAEAEAEAEQHGPDDAGDDSADDAAQAERASQERKFSFSNFSKRFAAQGVVDAFVRFAAHYRDLDHEQLKRAHRYFYRLAFKIDMSVMLFRVDILHLLHSMVKGPEPLDPSSSMRKEWDELARQIIKKCVRKLEQRPILLVEMLFSKTANTANYLEYGFMNQTSRAARPAAELEFRNVVDREKQVAITVNVLLDRTQGDHVDWVKASLNDAAAERRAWEEGEEARRASGEGDADSTAKPDVISIRPDSDAHRMAMFKNPHLRLLMKLVGIEHLAPDLDETPESGWIIPASATAQQLQESLDLVNKATFSPPLFEDGKTAEDQLRRVRRRATRDEGQDDAVADFLDDEEEDEDAEAFLFAPGGPTARKPDGERPKKTRRNRRAAAAADDDDNNEDDDDDEAKAKAKERARKRRERELEKMRKIKSAVLVDPADDESDEERDADFFLREKMRQDAKDASFGGLLGRIVAGEEEREEDEDDGNVAVHVATGEKSNETSAMGRGRAKNKRKGQAEMNGIKKTVLPWKRKAEAGPASSDEASDAQSPSSESSSSSHTRKRARRVTTSTPSSPPAADREEKEDEDGPAQSTQSSTRHTDEGVVDTPPSSSPRASSKGADGVDAADDEDEDEDEDMPLVGQALKARPRVRAGFIVDSSDEE